MKNRQKHLQKRKNNKTEKNITANGAWPLKQNISHDLTEEYQKSGVNQPVDHKQGNGHFQT